MSDEQSVSITFRTAAAKRDLLDEIARNMKRDRSFVVNEAVEQYLADFKQEQVLLAQGLADIARGDTFEGDELQAEVEGWVAEAMDKVS